MIANQSSESIWNPNLVAVFATLVLVASCSSQLHLAGDKEVRLQLKPLPNWGRAGGILIYFALPGKILPHFCHISWIHVIFKARKLHRWNKFKNLVRTKIYSCCVSAFGSNILYNINERIVKQAITSSKWFQLWQVRKSTKASDADWMTLSTNKRWSNRASQWNIIVYGFRLNISSDISRISPSSWELNAPIDPGEPDMEEDQSRTLHDVLGSIYSGFGFSSDVETPATSAAPSRRSSNRSSIRSAHSLKTKRRNRNELIFEKKSWNRLVHFVKSL